MVKILLTDIPPASSFMTITLHHSSVVVVVVVVVVAFIYIFIYLFIIFPFI